VSKILEGLKAAIASAKCNPHPFEFLTYHTVGGGVVGYCPECKCRFTAWPGGVHYDGILAARERQRKGLS
jgi:hypothetical protein